MRCIVCDGAMVPHFRKDFEGHLGLDVVHYERCVDCGLVVSRTHFELDDGAWSTLNEDFHASYFGMDVNAGDPRWLERLRAQAEALAALHGAGLAADGRPWLDWGAGDGKLSALLAERGVTMQAYDRFIAGQGFLRADELREGAFGLVLTTSVLEHLRDRATLDEIHRLVAPDGVLALHTLVREEIPADPSWFYLFAVHCTFFTNAAMRELAAQWGYDAALYHVPSRLWWLTHQETDPLRRLVARAGIREAHVDERFVGYWS
jgi:SAM-dependent methyltransferase